MQVQAPKTRQPPCFLRLSLTHPSSRQGHNISKIITFFPNSKTLLAMGSSAYVLAHSRISDPIEKLIFVGFGHANIPNLHFVG